MSTVGPIRVDILRHRCAGPKASRSTGTVRDEVVPCSWRKGGPMWVACDIEALSVDTSNWNRAAIA